MSAALRRKRRQIQFTLLKEGETTTLDVRDESGTKLDSSILAPFFSSVAASTKSDTAYTLVLGDAGYVIETTASSATTITVPASSTVDFPVGTVIELLQYGSGKITVAPYSGVIIRTASSLTSRAQYSSLALRKRDTDEWIISGDLT